MQTRIQSDHAANVIPLFTTATITAIPRPAHHARVHSLSKPDAQRIEIGIANALGQGGELDWFWEDAALVLLGSTGIGAIGIAFRFLA